MNTRTMVVVAAIAVLGCNKSATGPGAGVSNSCTVTLSGTVAGSYDCQPATTSWSSIDNTGGFSFGVAAAGTRPAMSVAVVWIGEPVTGRTYTDADSAAEAVVSVTTAASQAWRVSVGEGTPAAGSYSLAFSSVVYNLPSQTGKGYTADGTLTATLPAVAASGATGVITLTATF